VEANESGLGRPSRYCDDPGHTRARAFAVRRALARQAADGEGQHAGAVSMEAEGEVGELAERPITDGATALAGLLAQFRDASTRARSDAAAHAERLSAMASRVEEVIGDVADPDAAGAEVAQAWREAGIRIGQAETAQASAEADARSARRAAENEEEQRAQADAAAEAAAAECEALRADTAQQVEAAQANARHAQAELERTRADAAEQVAAARAAQEQAERRAYVAEQAQADAEARLAEERSTVEGLRGELAELRSQHRSELAELRAEHRAEREQFTREREEMAAERARHAEQLTAAMHTSQASSRSTRGGGQAGGEKEDTSAPPRRGSGTSGRARKDGST
jgi:chromosome segregation ATPase